MMILSDSEIRLLIKEVIDETSAELLEKVGSAWGTRHKLGRRSGMAAIRGATQVRSAIQSASGETEVSSNQYRINDGVKLTPAIKNAFQWLQPYLPKGAVMTSGLRTQEDQDRIIRKYAKRNNVPSDDLDVAHKKLKGLGFKINRFIGRAGHGDGTAFDVSGANLDEIVSAVKAVSKNDSIPVKLAALIERKNNAVHVTVKSVSKYDPTDYVSEESNILAITDS
jgi:hypothetical protein